MDQFAAIDPRDESVTAPTTLRRKFISRWRDFRHLFSKFKPDDTQGPLRLRSGWSSTNATIRF